MAAGVTFNGDTIDPEQVEGATVWGEITAKPDKTDSEKFWNNVANWAAS